MKRKRISEPQSVRMNWARKRWRYQCFPRPTRPASSLPAGMGLEGSKITRITP